MNQKVKKAVIPAAGLGTRFLPATKATPKEMLPVLDKPAIQYVVEEVASAGIEDVLIIIGRNKNSIEDHFDYCVELEHTLENKGKNQELHMIREISRMADVHFVRQKEPLGLGHAVYCARKFIGHEPFAVLLGDDIVYHQVPCIKQLLDAYQEKDATILGVQKVPDGQVNKYGIVDPEFEVQNGNYIKVKNLIEKPAIEKAPSNLAVLGRYILDGDIFDILQHTPPGAGGEIQLTDGINELAQNKEVWAFPFEGRRYDVGDKLGYLEATVEYAMRREELADDFKDYLKGFLRDNP